MAQVRLRGRRACLLIHIESQAQEQADFERRMFRYFVRWHGTYGLPVVPIALLSDRAVGREPGSDRYVVRAPHRAVLEFQFQRIELKRHAWSSYLKSDNPVAGAVMSRMNIAKADRPKVKSACLRMIAGLRLDPARLRMLTGFIDAYLPLDRAETEEFLREIGEPEAWQADSVLELTTSWKEEGCQEGLVLRARFGELPAGLEQRLTSADGRPLERLKAVILTASLDEVGEII